MSYQSKVRLLAIGFLVVSVWPLAQVALVQTFGGNPWKLFGWGMYATPQPVTSVQLFKIREGELIWFDTAGFPAELQREIRDYEIARRDLGQLLSPARLAARMMDTLPHLEEIIIRVNTKRLDRASARIATESKTYRYVRD